MCGLFAAVTESPLAQAPVSAALQRMFRRGPDDQGAWQEAGVCLGHRRLSILDLDTRAAQPMHSA